VRKAYLFNEIAVTVCHWFEPGEADEEHGARVEVRTLTPQPRRGGLAAAQITVMDGLLLRVDMFDLIGQEPGNMRRAHYHTEFDDSTPVDRRWSDELSSDPFGWLEHELRDLPRYVEQAGVVLSDLDGEAAELRAAVPQIVADARSYQGKLCTSVAACLEQTRHGRDLVPLLLAEYRNADPVDPRLAGLEFDVRSANRASGRGQCP